MRVVKTVVFPIKNPDKDLMATMQAYSEGMNYASRIVYRNHKPMSVKQLREEVCHYLKHNLGLRSQQCKTIPQRVAFYYQKLKNSVANKKAVWHFIDFKSTVMMLDFKREFRISKDVLKVTTLTSGRKRYFLELYGYARRYFDGTWNYLASKIKQHNDGKYYFHMEVEKHVPNARVAKNSKYLGIDVGLNNFAVAATTDKKCKFLESGRIKNLRNKYNMMRKRLELKGTLSAKRMLKKLAEKEKRLMQQINHQVSKNIVTFAIENGVSIIALEDLYGIGDIPFADAQNYDAANWFYRQLQIYIQYKAREASIDTMYVDPTRTSQICSVCGHTSKENRDRLKFKCKACGYENNADLNAAINIATIARDCRHREPQCRGFNNIPN